MFLTVTCMYHRIANTIQKKVGNFIFILTFESFSALENHFDKYSM